MTGKEILSLVDLEEEDSPNCGLLSERMSAVRKKINLPPLFVVSSDVFRGLRAEGGIPEESYMPWNVEMEIAKGFDELESPVVRVIPSPSYEHSLPELLTYRFKPELVLGIDALFRSYFEEEEVTSRKDIGVSDFYLSAIVQKMFDAKASGRLTVAPEGVWFSAVHGLPIDIENADSFDVDAEGNLKSHEEVEQKTKWELGDGGVEKVNMEEDAWDTDKLTEKQVSRLVKLGMTILELCGEPMMVEWSLVRNTFYVPTLYPSKIGFTED